MSLVARAKKIPRSGTHRGKAGVYKRRDHSQPRQTGNTQTYWDVTEVVLWKPKEQPEHEAKTGGYYVQAAQGDKLWSEDRSSGDETMDLTSNPDVKSDTEYMEADLPKTRRPTLGISVAQCSENPRRQAKDEPRESCQEPGESRSEQTAPQPRRNEGSRSEARYKHNRQVAERNTAERSTTDAKHQAARYLWRCEIVNRSCNNLASLVRPGEILHQEAVSWITEQQLMRLYTTRARSPNFKAGWEIWQTLIGSTLTRLKNGKLEAQLPGTALNFSSGGLARRTYI